MSAGTDTGILFSDLHVESKPSAIDTPVYKKDGIFIGEAIVQKQLKNGKYRIRTSQNKIFDARAIFNLGESVIPSGIPVIVIVQNADALILGRVRATRDDDGPDGDTDTDRSTTIGTPGDAQLKPQATEDTNITGEVTVTTGNVVKVRSTGATSITLHPHGERIVQRCQSLLAFTDAHRIESGRKSGKAGGVQFDALTVESFKARVGPARTEVRVKNGKVDGSTVHQMSVDTLATSGGSTTGATRFKSSIDDTGNWTVGNCSKVKIGDQGNEPVVLGSQLVSLLKAIIQDMSTQRTALTSMSTALQAAGAAMAAVIGTPVGMAPPVIQAALLAWSAAVQAAHIPNIAAQTSSAATLALLQTQFLTPLGISKELVLSDFFSTQKVAPIPGVVSE